MKKQLSVAERLKNEYYKTQEITNVKELLYRSASIYEKRIAFKFKDTSKSIQSVTYGEFKKDVQALGSYLLSKNLKNQKICVIGKNSYKWATSYFAGTIAGIVVPLDKELHVDEIINFMNVSQAEAILGDSKILKKVLENKDKLKNSNILFIGFERNSSLTYYDNVKNEGMEIYNSRKY